MNLWAIIPAKPLHLGKTRLAGVLGTGERTALNRRLFQHVFETALAVLPPERVAVVTTDAALLALASAHKAHAVQENETSDLNTALRDATRCALAHNADAVLILPGDLPLLTADDIFALQNAIGPKPSCVIAPDAAGIGTNALALAPPYPDFFHFGPESFIAHLEQADARNLKTEILRRPGLAHDLDSPEDHRRFSERLATAPAS